jgi:hypothetical protein
VVSTKFEPQVTRSQHESLRNSAFHSPRFVDTAGSSANSMRSQRQPLRLTASECAEHRAAQAPSTKWVHRQSAALEPTRARALTARSVGIVEIGPARALRNRPSWLRIALQLARLVRKSHRIRFRGHRDGTWHSRVGETDNRNSRRTLAPSSDDRRRQSAHPA